MYSHRRPAVPRATTRTIAIMPFSCMFISKHGDIFSKLEEDVKES
jgi:hypothetical protein